MELLLKYFPDLTPEQHQQFELVKKAYLNWNEKINVISRKDMDNFAERHVLHSLAIAKVIQFVPGTTIMDVGTGGGFPGVPLAILFPECKFTLVDSIGKKITVVKNVCQEVGIKNIEAYHERAEKINGKFDFIVSRAVTEMPEFIKWVQHQIKPNGVNSLRNGILYLKGGDLSNELSSIKQMVREYPIAEFFTEEFFTTKKVVYVKWG